MVDSILVISMSSERIFIVFDTECTGLTKIPKAALNVPASILNRGSEVLQIGGIILNNQMIPQKMFCHCCDTVIADSEVKAFQVHGISMKDIRKTLFGQFLPEILTRYVPEFFYENVCFIGYNSEYDMMMVAQSLANSPCAWDWKPLRTSVIPKTGRWSIDVAEFLRVGKSYKRLSSFEKELEPSRIDFMNLWPPRIGIESNCGELIGTSWEHAHNSFYDAVSTFLLWGDRIWKKKIL